MAKYINLELSGDTIRQRLLDNINNKKSILDEYKDIKSNTSDLTKDMQRLVIGMIEEEE